MDIVAHGLWAGAAGKWLRDGRKDVSRRTVGAIVLFAVLPDLAHMLPVLAASLAQPAPFAFVRDYVTAMPGARPAMPPWAAWLAHNLHCAFHSVVVLGAATALAAWKRRALVVALAGWWLHVAIDVPTHSSEYYPVPIFYPFGEWGFDGVAWTTPWLLAANYALLALVFAWLHLRPRRRLAAG